ILGEATTLSTFILKNNQRLTKANYVHLSRMTSMIIEYEIEFESNNEKWKNESNEQWLQTVDPLLKNLILLRSRLNQERINGSLDASYLKPFCDVIVNKDVSGPVTGLALQSIQKFLNFGFVKDGEIVKLIAESVTKARFVGTDSNSDEAVLMTILAILESLIVMPFYSLTNGLICEIMQSCFRIAFESRLSELLRKCAVKSLTEMVRALFTRISLFQEKGHHSGADGSLGNGGSDSDVSDFNYFYHDKNNASFHKLNRMGKRFVSAAGQNKHVNKTKLEVAKQSTKEDLTTLESHIQKSYGLACVHELLSYLTSLINPLPDGQNTEYMVNVGLQLLTIIFEISVHEIGANYCLLSVVKTDLCWNIMQLLQNEKNLNTFSNVLRLSFLVFVDLRMHLKYQFEVFLLRIMDIVATVNIPLEYRDICMEYLLQFFHHIPYLPHELFFNYDCDSYASNILEDLLQLLSKNCFSSSTNNNQHQNVPTSPTSLSSSSNLNFTALQILSFEVLLSNLKSLQMAELLKDKDVYLIANPATMIVNISNIRDLAVATFAVAPKQQTNDDEKRNSLTMEQFNNNNVINDINQQTQNNYHEDNLSATSLANNTMADAIGGDNENGQVDHDTIEQPLSTEGNYETENFELVNNCIQVESTKQNIQQTVPEPNAPTINKYCVTYLFPQKPNLLNSEQIEALKQRKILLWAATEKFNQKPTKGIEYLYENKLVQNDDDVVSFLRNNSRLDKKPLGEYLSNKKNMTVLSKFVQSFTFKDIRIDEALRLYLESFRLPGEAPLISLVLEQFAHHWHESNGCPFVNEDAAFSLAYAIIMLNVDQHNSNVKRQTNPMTCEEFISNLRQVNGGTDFDRNMLTEIYHMIKNNEIIMPAEQQGVIREKYLWKCLLKNSETLSGVYWFHLNNVMKNQHDSPSSSIVENHFKNTKEDFVVNLSILDRSIFEISCLPSISTLTLVFDKLNPDRQPCMSRLVLNQGFASCSLLCANYGHLDNLIENLSKFVIASPRITTKSELVAYCLFNICKEYANEMRSSWKNIIELILYWYDNKLLDDGLEIDDFALESKKISFTRKTPLKNLKQQSEQNQSTFFLSSFYSYFSSNSPSDQDIMNNDNDVIGAGNGTGNVGNETNDPEQSGANNNNSDPSNQPNDYCQTLILIIEESKFLHIDSLIELIKALIQVEYCDTFDDDIEVFKMEMLLKVIFMNRDRLSIFWDLIYRHIIKLMRYCPQSEYLTERIISCVFRLAIRFTSRPDLLNDQIFLLLYQILIFFDPYLIQRKHTAQTLHSFISHCNCYLTKNEQWALVYNLILAISIGYYPPNKKLGQPPEPQQSIHNHQQAHTPSTPDSTKRNFPQEPMTNVFIPSIPSMPNDLSKLAAHLNVKKNLSENIFSFNTYQYRIMDAEAYEKCVDIMVLIIREYLPNNAKSMQKNDSVSVYEIAQMAVGVLCRFVEASIKIQFATARPNVRHGKNSKIANKSRLSRLTNAILSSSESDSDDEYQQQQQQQKQPVRSEITSVTENVALKLLDLMHYFHLYAPTIAGDQIGSDVLWNTIWCPLLQAIAFFCCDCRRPVRTCAFTFLQRTLLLHDLQVLNANQWESCFNKVLFPLLSKLLEPINMCDPIGMDETRMRTTNLLCKKEAIPESLKNILLVMKTAGCFNETLASITWDRINKFLPNLYRDLIEPQIKQSEPATNQEMHHIEAPSSLMSMESSQPNNQSIQTEDHSKNLPPPTESIVAETNITGNSHQQPSQTIPTYPIYNLPSTFIDMESVCIHSDSQQLQQKTAPVPSNPEEVTNPISHLNSSQPIQEPQLFQSTSNPLVYPGTIAQFYPRHENSSMIQTTGTSSILTNTMASTNYPILYSSIMDTNMNKMSMLPQPGRILVPQSSSSYPWPSPNDDTTLMNAPQTSTSQHNNQPPQQS
ncbi:G-box binding factor, partial [Dermatophagoides farinae]